jgi:transcriptional regulator GlxA family with amidase domain
VRRFRVEEAAHLLSATDLPLKGVAARSGLGDPSTLWRSFQTEYGLTPDEYRTRFSSVLSARAS